MKLSDLSTGMKVVLRNGTVYTVLAGFEPSSLNRLYNLQNQKFIFFEDTYTEDLRHSQDTNKDIVAVYKHSHMEEFFNGVSKENNLLYKERTSGKRIRSLSTAPQHSYFSKFRSLEDIMNQLAINIKTGFEQEAVRIMRGEWEVEPEKEN